MRIVIRQNHHGGRRKGLIDAVAALLADLFRVQNQRRQVELLSQFRRPLLTQGSGTDHDQAPLAFGPVLAKHQPGLNGFSQSDFIAKNNALGERRPQGKQGRIDLMGIQIHTGVKERRR